MENIDIIREVREKIKNNPKYVNPMNKIFQEDIKRYGFESGNKYINWMQLNGISKSHVSKELYVDRRSYNRGKKFYTEKELLDILRNYPKENDGKIPTYRDFQGDIRYPGVSTYVRTFGTFQKALKLVELDFESMVKKGIIDNTHQKARLAEIIVRDHFKQYPIDLAGDNCLSPCDGICPNGKTYDVKSSKFYSIEEHWIFRFANKYKSKIEILYLLGFNSDYTELEYALRVSTWKYIDKEAFKIGLHSSYEDNIENMREYIITDHIREILIRNNYFEKIRDYRKLRTDI